MGRLLPVDGVRVRFRTKERDGRPTATATIWLNDEPLQEIATLDLELVESPGDESYQAWVRAVSDAFGRWLQRRTGMPGLVMKRQKPTYKGE